MKVTLTPSELRVMEEFSRHSRLSIREVQESYPGKKRPPYTSVQGTVNRLKKRARCGEFDRLGRKVRAEEEQ